MSTNNSNQATNLNGANSIDSKQFNKGFILPSLLKQLQSILEQYPDDGQILKELIQNAEDAKAKKVIFLLDNTTYPQQSLHAAELSAYQGPALYVYNDAVFETADWNGIRMLNDSVKEKDPMKVGRFGLGFKSVFHMTDLPSIFSGEGIAFLDPHELHFKNGRYPTSSYLWNLKSDKEEISRLSDQFSPYLQELFGATKEIFENGFFPGTLFRFPFRTEGVSSDLCPTKYDVEKARSLFASLEADAHVIMLFLKSIEKIEVYEKLESSLPAKRIMSIEISAESKSDVTQKRNELVNMITKVRSNDLEEATSVVYMMSIDFVKPSMVGDPDRNKWLISHYYGSKNDLDMANGLDESLGLLPWVAVALPVSSDTDTPHYVNQPEGHVFCFLPLPRDTESPTGFRFHVHGYFAVDQNRRHIKQRSAEQYGADVTDKSIQWNEYLTSKLLCKALVNAMEYATTRSSSNAALFDTICSSVPDRKLVKQEWRPFAEAFLQELPRLAVFYSPIGGGRYSLAKDALFDSVEDTGSCTKIVRRILHQSGTHLVSVPGFVLEQLGVLARLVDAPQVCVALKSVESSVILTDHDRMTLLKYLAAKLSADNKENEIIGMKLLPLGDDSWIEFKHRAVSGVDEIYVDDEDHPRTLLPGLHHLFVSVDAIETCRDLALSGSTQLTMLNESSVAMVIRSRLLSPFELMQELHTTDLSWFTDKWLNDVWNYLSKYYRSDLIAFEKLHMLPVRQDVLGKLSTVSPIVVGRHGATVLDETLKTVCEIIGVRVVDNFPAFILDHPACWNKFLLTPDVQGILCAVDKIEHDKVVEKCTNLSDAQRDELRRFIVSGVLSNDGVLKLREGLIRVMPIFRTLEGSGFRKSSFVSLTEVSRAAPSSIIPVEFPVQLLDLSDKLVCAFAETLNIEQLSFTDALLNIVIPAVNEGGCYDKELIVKLFQFVCDKWTECKNEKSAFHNHVADVKFIPKSNGDLAAPRELFDATDMVLRRLFIDEDVFPTGVFGDSRYLHILNELGLKGQDKVTAMDVLKLAQKLDSQTNPSIKCAQALLLFLEDRVYLLSQVVNGNTLLHNLSSLKWVLIAKNKPGFYPDALTFHGQKYSSLVCECPSRLKSYKHSALVGSVLPLVLTDCIGKLSEHFAWETEPDIAVVVENLLSVISCYTMQQKADFHVPLKEIYSYLNKLADHFTTVDHLLHEKEWIFHSDGFAAPRNLVLDQPFLNLHPYVYVIPEEFQVFEDLWQTVGVRDQCDLTEVLEDIAKKHRGSVAMCLESDDMLVQDISAQFSLTDSKRDLSLSVSILNEVASFSADKRMALRDRLQVPIDSSDDTLQLKPINECTYCDKEWFQQGLDFQNITDKTINLVHKSISLRTAEDLNIYTMCSRVMEAEEMTFGDAYGQSEPLPRRLKNILQEYTDGLAVLKELIQNADDAGATEVKFLYDERVNSDAQTTLIDQGMKPVQGAAFWVYNNALFTGEDFDNLVKLSGATKELCKDKIGRFGLGFNAVYNLTDVPSLISANHVVFLDPHTTHLKRAIRDKSKPGIKLDMRTSSKTFDLFPDQFKPYNGIFECDFAAKPKMTSYPGTLFRFPLRNEEESKRSEISNKHYSKDEMHGLLALLAKCADHLLLFTQRVEKITVFHLGADSANPEMMKPTVIIQKHIERILRPLCGDQPYAVLKAANSAIANRSSSSQSDVPRMESSLVLRVESEYLECSETSKTYWLVTASMGKGESNKMAVVEDDLISVGGVAASLAPLVKAEEVKTDDVKFRAVSLTTERACPNNGGTVFCFLPLPIKSSLPVHINGFFAVTSSRMHLFEETVSDKTDRRAVWNTRLMEDAVKDAYVIMLEDIVKLGSDTDSYCVWPRCSPDASLFSHLIDSLYRNICDENGPKVFISNGTAIGLSHCRFLDDQYRQSKVGATTLHVFQQVKTDDFEVIDFPSDLLCSIMKTSAATKFESRAVKKPDFIRDWFLPNIDKLSVNLQDLRDQLTIDALLDDQVYTLLRDYECIPVRPNRSLKQSKNLVHPTSLLAVLYDESEECFPKFEISDSLVINRIYQQLVKLGMKHHQMTWEEIAERCYKVHQKPEVSSDRLKVLISLMNLNLTVEVNSDDMVYVEMLRQIPFLPVKKKPSSFPLPWYGDECDKYTSCDEAYSSTFQKLVCCSFPIIDDHTVFSVYDSKLRQLLRLSDEVIAEETVFAQLDSILELTDEQGKLCVKGPQLDHIWEVCDEVYRFLDKGLREHILNETSICDGFNSRKSIVLRDTALFMSPKCCAKELGTSREALLPYMCALPSTFQRSYKSLLASLAIKETFSAQDYIDVLQELKARNDSKPLSVTDLKVVISIVNDCLSTCTDLPPDQEIPVPDINGVLCSASSMCFCIDPRMFIENTVFCHAGITWKAAKKLGVKSLDHAYFDQHAIGIPFGQSEKLVTRLKRILSGYPFDEAVLKEMLQNADDAGATVVHFILDCRQLPTEHTFDDKWKPLQGPALCVYNNKPFTESDISGIQNLGEGNKGEDPTKTGQFGVGFNCVYHVTDVPSLLTHVAGKEVLCIFDPNCCYAPGATPEKPGRRLNINHAFKEKFDDVFMGYFEEEYEGTGGTLFRLPLRDDSMAILSNLSDKPVSIEKIKKLFETFKSDMNQSLLFLNSVVEVHLKIKAADGSISTIYYAKTELEEEALGKRERMKLVVKDTASRLKRGEISLQEIGVYEEMYELKTIDSKQVAQEWIVAQRFGFDESDVVPQSVSVAYEHGDIGLLPRAGVAYLCSNNDERVHRSRLFCFLPLPVETQLPVHINGHFALDSDSRRNLWRNIAGDYRTDWNTFMMNHIISPAYCSLIMHFRNTIPVNADIFLDSYYSIFPDVTDAKDSDLYVNEMSRSVYQRLASKNMPVLLVYTLNQSDHWWLSPSKNDKHDGHFDNLSFQIPDPASRLLHSGTSQSIGPPEKNRRPKDQIVRDILCACGFILFNSPISIFRNFIKAKACVKEVTADAVLNFFATSRSRDSLCRVQSTDLPIGDTVFKNVRVLAYLLDYCTMAPNHKEKLLGLPLLVTCDNYLRTFDEATVKFEPQFADVLPHCPEQFMQKNVFHILKLDAAKDTRLCRKLSIQDFTERLPGLLPRQTFQNMNGCIEISELFTRLEGKKVPQSWLLRVWQFFSSLVEATKIPEILKPMQDWCLMPALCVHRKVLLPIVDARCVIPMTGSVLSKTLERCLFKLGIPQPLLEYFYLFVDGITVPKLYNKVVGSLERADSIVMALELLFSRQLYTENNPTLTEDECQVLLEYLSKNLRQWQCVPKAIETVQRLPVFCTVYRKLVPIHGSCAYIIPNKIPVKDMESWTSTRSVIFLRSDERIQNILLHLGCKELTEVEVYCGFILKHFELLTDEGKLVHLKHVRDKLLPDLKQKVSKPKDQEKRNNESMLKALLESLRDLDFVPNSKGIMACARDLYDPKVDVFKAMLNEEDFPWKPFNEYEWLGFLRECGLKHVVTQAMFLKYARQVAEIGQRGMSEDLLAKSKVLVSHLFSRDDLFTNSFLGQVRDIAFIVPLSVGSHKERLHPQYGKRIANSNCLQLISFAGSIVDGFDDHVWTVQTILPGWANPTKCRYASIYSDYKKLEHTRQKVLEELQIHKQPELSKVAQHVEKLCGKLASCMEAVASDTAFLDKIMLSIYEFLKSKLPLPNGISALLTTSPLVYDRKNNLLVRANQTSMSQSCEIRPYLISSPRELGRYGDLFLALGATEFPTIEQYADVLRVIHDNSLGTELLPNEQCAVALAVCHFFTLLKHADSKSPIKLTNTDLYLPCSRWRMHKSSNIVFDNKNLSGRIPAFDQPVLVDLEQCQLKIPIYEIESLIEKLPAAAQPQLFSAVVKETLKSETMTVNTCSLVIEIETRIRSEEFRKGFQRLVYDLLTRGQRIDSLLLEKTIEEILANLQHVIFVGVDNLTTVFTYKGTVIKACETRKDLFWTCVVEPEQTKWILYVCTSSFDCSSSKRLIGRLFRTVANVIIAANKGRIHAVDEIKSILECETHEIDSVLDDLDVKPMMNGGVREESPMPVLGTYVPIKYHCYLRQDMLQLATNELAALEIDDPMNSGELDEMAAPTYIFVKVLERFLDDGNREEDSGECSKALVRYKIKINSLEEINVSASLLYAFIRPKKESSDPTDPIESPDDYVSITRDLKSILRDAYRLSEDEKKTILKRLFLRWSPEKNLHNADVASKVTEFILLACEKLDKGQPIDDDDVLKINTPMYTRTLTQAASSCSSSGYNSLAGSCFRYMQERAKQHRQHQQQYEKALADSKTDVQRRKNENFLRSFVTQSNPQPGEGRRWLRQAEADMMAARNDEGAAGCEAYEAYEWSCYKYYQAAVKALRGVLFARDANKDYDVTGSIHHLIRDISDRTLSELVQSLTNVVGDRNRMQYPCERGASFNIPHELYSAEKAHLAKQSCEMIVEWCRKQVDNKV